MNKKVIFAIVGIIVLVIGVKFLIRSGKDGFSPLPHQDVPSQEDSVNQNPSPNPDPSPTPQPSPSPSPSPTPNPSPSPTPTPIPGAFKNKEVFYKSGPRDIQAFLYKPEGTNLPAILFLHGGFSGFTKQSYVEGFYDDGYVMLAINYPGEGKSEGTLGDVLAEKQAAIDAVSYLKSLSYVNDAKIGIFGTSHGGAVALSTIESVNVAAAVDAYGPVDLLEFCKFEIRQGTSRFGFTEEEQCDTISPSILESRSISGVLRMNTPLLVLHGVQDNIVPVSQSDSLASELDRLGKIYKYKRYPNAKHGFLFVNSADARDGNREIDAWFEKYLK